MGDVAKTPREELECEKRYLYEYSMFWECNEGSKCQILEDDVCDLLNEQQANIKDLNFMINFQEKEIDSLKALLKEKEALTEENEELKRQLDKIPPKIKEVWLE